MLAEEIVSDLLTREVLAPSAAQPPSSPGFYAWWCREEQLGDAFPGIPKENRPPVPTSWSLLYVGISPSGPTSSRNIAIRLAKDHAGGNIGGSTFRQSLAALLTGTLKLEPRRGSDRSRLVSEVPLSRWIESACGVSFATAERPWGFETDVIAILNPPLNIDCGTHPFRLEVKARRAALRQACGIGA